MEENNRKGPGVFYAVVGVATLVVAIIGATFAYFSASANAENTITGTTNSNLASALSITVNQVTWEDVEVPSSDLVPADFGELVDGALSKAQVQAALTSKCVNAGYTGCHLWKIEANTTQSVANASVLLDLKVETAEVKTNWRYAVFTATGLAANINTVGTDDTLTITDFVAVPEGKKAQNNLETNVVGLDIHNNAAMTAGTVTAPSNTYYVLVYLANVEGSQNNVAGADEDPVTNELGSYTGTVSMNAAGGQVKATFTAA